jgi:hypothetical protein
MTKFRIDISAIKIHYANTKPSISPWRRFCAEMEKTGGVISMEGALSDWTVEFADEEDAVIYKLKFGA